MFEFEFEVDPQTSYVPGARQEEVVNTVRVLGDQIMALVTMRNDHEKIGGVRLSPEDMDRLCKEWMDHRRVCPFCHKPYMDVATDEAPHFEDVITRWECEHCGGAIDTAWEAGSVSWEDPIGDTR